MSEVSGPPDQKGLKPVMRVPEISKRDQKPDHRKPPEQQEQQKAASPEGPTLHARDPAVSLSASVGHIELGETIEGSIISIDADGRPILITPEATFALTPDAGLKAGDSINLNVVTTDHLLKADLTLRNGKPEIPPITLTLTLVSVKHIEQTRQSAPHAEELYLNKTTGAYIPPATAPVNNPPLPQTSLSSGVYNPTLRPDPTTVSSHSSGKSSNELPKPLENKKEMVEKVISQTKQPPDPTMIQSSTSDMATLLVNQQVSVPSPAPVLQPRKVLPEAAVTPQQKHKAGPANISEQTSKISAYTPKTTPPDPSEKSEAKPTTAQPISQPISQAIPRKSEQSLEKAIEPAVTQKTQQNTATIPDAGTVNVIATQVPHTLIATVSTASTAQSQQSESPAKTPIVPHETMIVGKAISNIDVSKTDHRSEKVKFPVIPAIFEPSKQAQAILTKARIPSPNIADKVEVILRAKQKQDSPQTLEVKVISVHEKTDQEGRFENSVKAPPQNTMENKARVTPEIKIQNHSYHVETSGGTVEFSLPDGQVAPKENDAMTIFVAQPEKTQALKPAVALPEKTMPLSLLSQGLKKWPALQKTHELISSEQQSRTMPYVAMQQISHSLTNRTAGGGARLTNSLLFMLAALKQGDASNWLGPQVETYLQKSGQQELINMLKQDITRFAGLINQPTVTSEWQPIVLPFAADDNSLLLALLFRPEHPDKNEKDGNSSDKNKDDQEAHSTRFILEVHFSNIGEIQLDGFIKEKNFDLKFRSLTPLAQHLKNDLRTLFSSALDASGYNGAITFYDLPIFPVDVATIINDAEPVTHIDISDKFSSI